MAQAGTVFSGSAPCASSEHQLGAALDTTHMRRQLSALRERRAATLREMHEKGIATLQICPRCGLCFDQTAGTCPADGASLETPRPLPYELLGRYRFEREARTIARISHPGVIALFDSGELPDGTAFLVMEKLKGHDLAHFLEECGPGTPRQVALLARQASEALVGRRAIRGEDLGRIMANVLDTVPEPVSALLPGVPALETMPEGITPGSKLVD